jgi:DNA primase
MLDDIQKLLDRANVNIQSQGIEEIAIYCPFHRNTDSASCYINTKTGLWQCFNPACGAKGNYRQLHRRLLNEDVIENKVVNPDLLKLKLSKKFDTSDDIELSIDNLIIDYDKDGQKLSSLIDRGFDIDTLKYFEVCYSDKKRRVVIPVRDESYKLVGMIGRAIDKDQEPRYLYTNGFKRAKVLFNLCNAKKYDSVIITEGSLDAIKIHQAGFPNVIATLGSKISENQHTLIRKYFDEIIAFPDADSAGQAMGRDIMVSCLGRRVRWAECPDGRGDPGDMTASEISDAVNNSKIKL